MRIQSLITAAVVASLASGCGLLLGSGGAGPGGSRDGGPSDAGSADASASDAPSDVSAPDGGLTARCGSPGAIVDSLNDGVRDPIWGSWQSGGGVMQVEAGDGLHLLPATTGMSYGGYYSVFLVDLRESATSIEVEPSLDPTAGVAFFAMTRSSGDYTAQFALYPDGLVMRVRIARVDDDVMIPYDPTAHRFWRLRESGGTLFFDTSPDRTTWTEQRATTAPDFVRAAYIDIGAGVWAATATPGHVVFRDVNLDVPPAPYCAPSTFSDDFEDGALSVEWIVADSFEAGCTFEERDGVARVSAPAGAICGFRTANAFDASNAFVTVELATPTTGMSGVWVNAVGPGYVDLWAADLGAEIELGHASALEVMPDLGHRFWRLGFEGSDAVLQTSADGLVWTDPLRVPSPIAPEKVAFGIGVNTRTLAPATSVAFAAYNR